MSWKITTTLLLFVCCTLHVTAQLLSFQQMDVRMGLPASEVYNLHQDAKGYVWAFTEYGIVKHNGTRFIPVCKNLPFSESAIYQVVESADGVMYVANSNAKIYRIAGDSAVLLPGLVGVSAGILSRSETIMYMMIDQQTIRFASAGSSYSYHLKTHRVQSLCEHQKTGHGITFQTIGATGIGIKCVHIVGINEKGAFRLVDNQGRVLFSIPFSHSAYGRNGIIRNGNQYYIMARNTVMTANRNGLLKKRQLDRATLSMQLAPDGHYWQGLAYGGLIEFDADLNVLHHYLPGVTVSDILFDNQGGMWVSTIGKGVFYNPNRKSTCFDEVSKLAESITLLKVINRQLFIGSASGKLFVYKDKRLHQIHLKQEVMGINDIIACENGYFVGARSGWFKLNNQLTQVGPHSNVNTGYAFAEQKNKHLLLISATSILEKSPDSGRFSLKLMAQRPRCIAIRKEGTIFISTRKGLYLLDNNNLVLPGYLKRLQGKNISRLYLDKQQNLWICTSGNGLFRLSAANKLVSYTGLPSSVITDICLLKNKKLVLATNKGAFISSMTNNLSGSWIQLIDNEVVKVEELADHLYLGTKLGLTILEKKELLKQATYPFYLESVKAGKKDVLLLNRKLEHYQNHLSFNFDLLAYSTAEKRLIYELKGPSPLKGSVNGTQLDLQNLAPGNYRLQVYPANYLKNKQQKGLALSFYIRPAFWQTGLFLFFVIFLSVIVIVLITWFVLHRARRKAEVREQVTRLLAVYRLTALKAQINPHFISNSLAAIQELVITDQTDRANQYLARFSLLIRYLLNYSDQSVASISDELKIIDLIIELEQLRFSNQFVFRKEIAATIDVENLFIPPLITQPFIENAIWHGLLPLKGKRTPELVLKIVLEEEKLIISISDNGVGRSGQSAKKKEDHESKGTGLIQHRIDNLNKLHTARNASIRFTDLENESGEPAGLRVDIIFPIDMLNTLYDEQDQEHYY